jgi:flagellar motor protein MotB
VKQAQLREQQQAELARAQALQDELNQQQMSLDQQQQLLNQQVQQQQFVHQSHQQQHMLEQQSTQQQQLQQQQTQLQQQYQEAQKQIAARQQELEEEHFMHHQAQQQLLTGNNEREKQLALQRAGSIDSGANQSETSSGPLLPLATGSMTTEAHIELIQQKIQMLTDYKDLIISQHKDAQSPVAIDAAAGPIAHPSTAPTHGSTSSSPPIQVKHEDEPMHMGRPLGSSRASPEFQSSTSVPSLPSAPHSQLEDELAHG